MIAVAGHVPVMVVTDYLGWKSIEFGTSLIEGLHDQVPSVVAVKDNVGSEFVQRNCLIAHQRWAIVAGGQKQSHMYMLPHGLDGYSWMHTMFKPGIALRYWKPVETKDLGCARVVIREHDIPLFNPLLKPEGGCYAGVHGLLKTAGLGARYRRQP